MRRGFTLLEVMISLSILALALTAIAGINANSFASSNYARGLTIATLLGRSKMLDIEIELQKDGFSESDRKLKGDFSEEGYDSVSWEAVVRPVDVDVSKLVREFFGGEISAESLPDQMQAFFGATGGLEGDDPEGQEVPADQVRALLGGESIEFIFRQVSETLGNSIREIVLDITWGPEDYPETVRFVQYVTTTGRISAPTGIDGTVRTPQTSGAIPPTLPGGIPNPAAVPNLNPTGGGP